MLAEFDRSRLAEMESGAGRGTIVAESTNWSRDLVNEPGNMAGPDYLAAQAEAMASSSGWSMPPLSASRWKRWAWAPSWPLPRAVSDSPS